MHDFLQAPACKGANSACARGRCCGHCCRLPLSVPPDLEAQVSSHPHPPLVPLSRPSSPPSGPAAALLCWDGINLKLEAGPDVAKQCPWLLSWGVFGHGALPAVNPLLVSLPGAAPSPPLAKPLGSRSRALTGAVAAAGPQAASSTAVLPSGWAGTKPSFISVPTERLKYSVLSPTCKQINFPSCQRN